MARQRISAQEIWNALRDLAGRAATPEGRHEVVMQLETKLRRSPLGGGVLDRIRLMYDYIRDPDEPATPKVMLTAALLYLIIPNDLIPDWVFLIGLTDDLAALSIVWNRTKDVLTHYERRRESRRVLLEV